MIVGFRVQDLRVMPFPFKVIVSVGVVGIVEVVVKAILASSKVHRD